MSVVVQMGDYTNNNSLRHITQAICTSNEGSICYDCLRKMGLDPYVDELIVSRYMNLYSSFGGRIHPSYIDNLLNGAMLTYEQWDSADWTDPALRPSLLLPRTGRNP